MLDPNKTLVIYAGLGLVVGFIIGAIVGMAIGNFSLWATVFSTAGLSIGLGVFYYMKSRY